MRPETEAASSANLINAVHRGSEQTPPHPLRQRRILWICVLGWTAFVGFAFWWLVKGNGGPSLWVDLDLPGFSQRVRAMFRGDLGLQRTYPWILFGPYLALIAWYFPLERERLRRNLPLNAVACLAFVWACYALALRTNASHARFVIIDSDFAPD